MLLPQRHGAGFESRAMSLADHSDSSDHAGRGRRNPPAAPTARYFFHLVKGPQRIDDWLGVQLREEVVTSPAVLDAVREVWPGTADERAWAGWSVQIVDSHGRVIRLLPL
jgi:hypothetical protein